MVPEPLKDKITSAEIKLTVFVAENKHSLTIAISDEFGKLFRSIFLDSKIAKKYQCGRTKSSAILNEVLAMDLVSKLVERMKAPPFSVATDGSNDTGVEKMSSVTIKVFVVNQHKIRHRFLDMGTTQGGTANEIFQKMNSVSTTSGISWQQCIGLNVDNTAVSMGIRNSIKTRVFKENSSVYIMGCPCHIIHNTAIAGNKAFVESCGFNVGNFAVDNFYWLDKRSKKKNLLLEFCEFVDIEYRDMLDHISVRWLSLEKW